MSAIHQEKSDWNVINLNVKVSEIYLNHCRLDVDSYEEIQIESNDSQLILLLNNNKVWIYDFKGKIKGYFELDGNQKQMKLDVKQWYGEWERKLE